MTKQTNKRKRGRPKNGDYPQQIAFRCSDADYKFVTQAAETKSISTAEYLRQLIARERGR